MDTSSNILLTVLFGGLGVWMLMGYFRCVRKLKYKDKMWTASRILFAVAGVLSLMSIFMYRSPLDFVRFAAMTMCIIAFLILRDGIGEEGIGSMGRLTPWKDVKAYDYAVYKKKVSVFFICEDKDAKKKKGEYTVAINFDAKDEKEITDYLNQKAGKKHIRMKKD